MSDVLQETGPRTYRKVRLDQLGLHFAKECFDDVIEDIKPLLIDHHAELAAYPDIPLAPDYPFYKRAADADHIRIYTRSPRRRTHWLPHRRHSSRRTRTTRLSLVSDIVIVVPRHRQAHVGNGLFDFFEADSVGCVASISAKNDHPELGWLLKLRGYEPISTNWCKRL